MRRVLGAVAILVLAAVVQAQNRDWTWVRRQSFVPRGQISSSTGKLFFCNAYGTSLVDPSTGLADFLDSASSSSVGCLSSDSSQYAIFVNTGSPLIEFRDRLTGGVLGSTAAPASVKEMKYSPDGQYLALISDLDILDVIYVPLAFPLFEVPLQSPQGVGWSPDGQEIAVSRFGQQSKLTFVDMGTGNQRSVNLDSFPGSVNYTKDGKSIIVPGYNKVYLYDRTLNSLRQISIPDANMVRNFAVSPNDKLFAIEVNRAVEIWDTASSSRLGRSAGVINTTGPITFTPDGSTVFSQSSQDLLYKWHVPDCQGQGLEYLQGTFIDVSKDGTMVAVDFDGQSSHHYGVQLFNASNGLKTLDLPEGTVNLGPIMFSPNGLYVADNHQSFCRVFRVSDGALVGTVGVGFFSTNSWSIDSTMIATTIGQDQLQVRRIQDGALVFARTGVADCVFSPTLQRLYAVTVTNGVYSLATYRTNDWSLLRQVPAPQSSRVCTSPDGRDIFVGTAVYDEESGHKVKTMPQPLRPFGRFAPDGQTYWYADHQVDYISVYRCSDFQLVSKIKTNGVSGDQDVAFLPDGRSAVFSFPGGMGRRANALFFDPKAYPSSMNLAKGTYVSGNLSDLQAADGSCLELRAKPQLGPSDPAVTLDIDGTSPVMGSSLFMARFVGQSRKKFARLRLTPFDWINNRFSLTDSATVLLSLSNRITTAIPLVAANFVRAGDRRVRVRIDVFDLAKEELLVDELSWDVR